MKKFMGLLLALTLALSLCACGGGATTSAPAAEEAAPAAEEAAPAAEAEAAPAAEAAVPEFVGAYKLVEVEESGDAYKSSLEEATELGQNIYLFVKEDGTCELEFFGEKDPRTWDENAFYGFNGLKPEEPAAYEYADGVLTLSLEDEDGPVVLKYAKLTEEEQAYYDENGSGNMEDYANAMMEKLGLDEEELAEALAELEAEMGAETGETTES